MRVNIWVLISFYFLKIDVPLRMHLQIINDEDDDHVKLSIAIWHVFVISFSRRH